jgi:hypothetical protein
MAVARRTGQPMSSMTLHPLPITTGEPKPPELSFMDTRRRPAPGATRPPGSPFTQASIRVGTEFTVLRHARPHKPVREI